MKTKSGFTIIEVMLFLAIAGLMMSAMLATIATSVNRQRYDDAVQDFYSFLQSVYNDVSNVQISRTGTATNRVYCTVAGQANYAAVNYTLGYSGSSLIDTADYSPGTAKKWLSAGSALYNSQGYAGRSECAVYGKLVVFGEKNSNGEKVYVYDVIGTTSSYANNTYAATIVEEDTTALSNVYADVVVLDRDTSSSSCVLALAGSEDSTYSTTWTSVIEDVDGSAFTGSVLIVRSPASTTIHTYFYDSALQIQDLLNSSTVYSCNAGSLTEAALPASVYKNLASFKEEEVNFCLNSDDVMDLTRRRRNLRIVEGASGASSVELIDNDSEDNLCA